MAECLNIRHMILPATPLLRKSRGIHFYPSFLRFLIQILKLLPISNFGFEWFIGFDLIPTLSYYCTESIYKIKQLLQSNIKIKTQNLSMMINCTHKY